MRVLVLGIGNPLLRDDGIGPRIVEELRGRISNTNVALEETNLAGMSLVEILSDYSHAIIIDAIQTGEKPGTLYRLTPENFQSSSNVSISQHHIGILQALQLGKELAQPMPEKVVLIAVEAEDIHNFGEGLTPHIEEAVPAVVARVLAELNSIMQSIAS